MKGYVSKCTDDISELEKFKKIGFNASPISIVNISDMYLISTDIERRSMYHAK